MAKIPATILCDKADLAVPCPANKLCRSCGNTANDISKVNKKLKPQTLKSQFSHAIHKESLANLPFLKSKSITQGYVQSEKRETCDHRKRRCIFLCPFASWLSPRRRHAQVVSPKSRPTTFLLPVSFHRITAVIPLCFFGPLIKRVSRVIFIRHIHFQLLL